MNNCLVTKLKATVNDDSLPTFGAIPLIIRTINGVTPTAVTQALGVRRLTEDTTIKIVGDGYFTDATLTQNLGKTANLYADTTNTVYFSPGNYRAEIFARYVDCVYINNSEALPSNSPILLDVTNLAYIPSLAMQVRGCTGNIECLAGITIPSSESFFDLGASANGDYPLTGNFEVLGNCKTTKNNQYFIIPGNSANNKVTGEIVNFVDNYIKAGNTYDVYLWCKGLITYNGDTPVNMKVHIISSTSWTATYNETTDTWVKNGDTWELQS